MYQLIETIYTGESDKILPQKIEIRTTPLEPHEGSGYLVDAEIIDGDIVYIFAHGKYKTLAEAEKAVHALFGSARMVPSTDSSVFATYVPGQYIKLSKNETNDWVDSYIKGMKNPANSNVRHISCALESRANEMGFTHDSSINDTIRRRVGRFYRVYMAVIDYLKKLSSS